MTSDDKDFDNIRNKISLPLIVLEKLSEGKSVDIKTLSLAYENLSEAKNVLDNCQDSSLGMWINTFE